MTDPARGDNRSTGGRSIRTIIVRVVVVQLLSLAILWLLQARYNQ